jgi:hypothetical protein
MGTSLFNTTPAATYPALLKVGDNSTIDTTLKTLSDGSGNDSTLQLSTRRLGILQDTGVTTQTSSVIQATTTNANLVIAPNGTGGLIAQIPDGTATGGNARGANAVDLQMGRTTATQVASGVGSVILGGGSNTSSALLSTIAGGSNNLVSSSFSTISGGQNNTILTQAYATIVGGYNNTATGNASIVGGNTSNASGFTAIALGQNNTASSNYSTVSGGQSNVASTNTHATVVGGQSNTASGQWSIAGGFNNVASGGKSTAFGNTNTVSGDSSLVSGFQNNVSGSRSFATGYSNTVSGGHSIAVGWGNTASGAYSGSIGSGTSASGTSSFATGDGVVAGGAQSFAQGSYSQTGTANSSAFGFGSYTSLTNQQALGNYLNYRGDSQTSRVVYSITTGSVASGGSYTFTGTELIVPKNGTYSAGVTQAYLCTAKFIYSTMQKVGTVNTINTKDCFTAIYNFAAKSTNNVGALIGTPTLQLSFSDPNLASTVVSITIGASGEILFTFTPPTWTGGGTIEFRGTLHLEFTEIGVYL